MQIYQETTECTLQLCCRMEPTLMHQGLRI